VDEVGLVAGLHASRLVTGGAVRRLELDALAGVGLAELLEDGLVGLLEDREAVDADGGSGGCGGVAVVGAAGRQREESREDGRAELDDLHGAHPLRCHDARGGVAMSSRLLQLRDWVEMIRMVGESRQFAMRCRAVSSGRAAARRVYAGKTRTTRLRGV